MIARKASNMCSKALPYYYDYTSSNSRNEIPEDILNHISKCQNCQDEIMRLNGNFEKINTTDPSQRLNKSTITTTLEYHFAHVNQYVSCNTVKAYLPALSIKELDVKIPTPITVHIDNCPACSKDLETIKRFNLQPKQLKYLSQIFLGKFEIQADNCLEIQKHSYDISSLDLSQTSAHSLKHYCFCSTCQDTIYKIRQSISNSTKSNQLPSSFPCNQVLPSDIFDYVAPYGIDPNDDEYFEFRNALTSHAKICHTCIQKIQDMHVALFGIIGRNDSDVITCFKMDDQSDSNHETNREDTYGDWPVNVQVIKGNGLSENNASLKLADHQETPTPNNPNPKRLHSSIKRILRPVAAAAVIILAFSLLLNTNSVQAINLNKIYEALKAVDNIHTIQYSPKKEGPVQEVWISAPLKYELSKTKLKTCFFDVPNQKMHILYSDGKTEIIEFSKKTSLKKEKQIAKYINIIPFVNFSDAPKGAQWRCISENSDKQVASPEEIYELTWKEALQNKTERYRKWLVTIDSSSYLIKQTKHYEKYASDDDYILVTIHEYDYPKTSQVKAIIDQLTLTKP